MKTFLLLGHGKYVEKYLGRGVIWYVAPESNIQEWVNRVSKTFSPKENGNLSKYVKEHVPMGFSNLLNKDLTLSISSWFR